MSSETSPRRVVLVLLLALWLAAQYMVIGLTPAWGYVLPHEHLTRGIVSETAWQQHLLQHRGVRTVNYALRCDAPRQETGSSILASIPDGASVLSVMSESADLHTLELRIPILPRWLATLRPATFHTFDVSTPPLEPPPNI